MVPKPIDFVGAIALVSCLALAVAGLPVGAVASGGASAAADEPTVEFRQTSTGNIFLANETVTVLVESDASRVTWTLERYGGQRVANGTVAVDGTARLTLPAATVGHYDLRAWPTGTAADPTTTTVGVLPADGFHNEDTFYGFSTHFAAGWDHDLMPLIEAAGAATVRDEHAWARVERAPGQYDFSGAVQAGFMEKLHGRDLQRLFLLSYGNPIYGGEWNHVPHNDSYRRAFANYSVAALDRYEDLAYVEVWNEPNLDTYGSGPAAQDPAAYAKLLGATYPAIEGEHPDVTVVGGSTAGVSPNGNRVDFQFWEGVLSAGGGDSMDAMSIHPYRQRPTNYATDVERLRNLTRKYNDGETLPIWVTEFGWRSGPRGGVAQATQARYLVRGHVGLRATDVQRAYWYTFRDDAPPNADVDRYPFGLVRHPDDPIGAHTPKPSLAAYATMTRQLAGAERVTERTEAPVTAYDYGPAAGSEAGDAGRRTVLWVRPDAGATDVTLHVENPVTVTTMTGEHQRLVPVDGEVYLTVGTDPLYVEGEVASITEGAPVAIRGTTDTLDLRATGDGGPLTVTHEVAGRSVAVTAASGATATETIDLPAAYRPLRPEGTEVFYLAGGHRVDDTVSIDGQPAGLLSARVRPTPIHRTGATSSPTPEPETDGPSPEPETDGPSPDPATDDPTPDRSPDGTGTTSSASGPGLGLLAAVLGVLALAGSLLAARTRR